MVPLWSVVSSSPLDSKSQYFKEISGSPSFQAPATVGGLGRGLGAWLKLWGLRNCQRIRMIMIRRRKIGGDQWLLIKPLPSTWYLTYVALFNSHEIPMSLVSCSLLYSWRNRLRGVRSLAPKTHHQRMVRFGFKFKSTQFWSLCFPTLLKPSGWTKLTPHSTVLVWDGVLRSHLVMRQKWWKTWDSGILVVYLGTLYLILLNQIFPKVHEIPLSNVISIHAHTALLSAVLLKYTIGTLLITVVSWGNHVKCISFYLRLTMAGGEGGHYRSRSLPPFLASISLPNGSGPRNVIHYAPLRLLCLILEASQSGGRRKGERKGWETGGHRW